MRIAVLGDIHLDFDAEDVALLDAEGYDAVLAVGDLGGYTPSGCIEVARTLAQLRTKVVVVPGNHDATHLGQLAAEVLAHDRASGWMGGGMRARVEALREALRPARLEGYSLVRLGGADGVDGVDCIVARPHSFGGPRLAFRAYLEDAFGIRTLEESAARLRALVDAATSPRLVFLAHSGPSGLGDTRDAPWGVDFRAAGGDHGDPDLEEAIAYATQRGRAVVAVVAGHMHHALRGGGQRRWTLRRDGTLYVNAARVPRIERRTGSPTTRHWVELIIDGSRCEARAITRTSGRDGNHVG